MRPMFTDHPALGFCFALGLAATSVSRAVLAQPSAVDVAQGRELLNRGLDLRNNGDAAGALPKLRAAHALVPTPVTGLELGRTYAALGKLVEARETFLSVGRLSVQPEETGRSKLARAQSEQLAEQLWSQIPRLTVKITGVPVATVTVTVDGAVVPTEALDVPRLLDLGNHDVIARSTSGGSAEARVDLKEGETRDVELRIVFTGESTASGLAPPLVAAVPDAPAASVSTSMVLPPAVPPPAAAQPPGPDGRRVLSWSLMGVGAAVGIAGAVLMGVEANNSKISSDRHNANGYNASKTWWTAGLVGVVVGGLTLASGGVALATITKPSSRSHASLWLGLGVAQLRLGGIW